MELQDFASIYNQTDSKKPAYQRVKDAVLQSVHQGGYLPGSLIPSENELVETLDLSRMTVNRAMRELTASGILTRTRGIGTFVAEPKAHGALMEVRNIADEIKMRGKIHTSQVLILEEVEPAQAPSGLKGHIFHSVIVHYENEVPFQLEDRYVSSILAPDYLTQNFSMSTPNEYLARVAPLSRGSHSVEAVLPSELDAHRLGIDQNVPCLLIRRRTYSSDHLVSVARILHPGSRIRLEGEF